MARSTDKPHIYLVKGLLGLPFWVCRMQGKVDGAGSDPQSAYRSWLNANATRSLDPTIYILASEVDRSLRVGGVIIALAGGALIFYNIGLKCGWW